MMVLLNKAEKEISVSRSDYESMIQLLAPFAPHLAEELWSRMGNNESVHLTTWPSYEEKYLIQTRFTLGVQVNGKVRGTIEINADATAEDVQKIALENPHIARWIEGKSVSKFIYIPQKIVNIIC